MAPTVLTHELLERLTIHPAVQGAPILGALAPGLTDAEIDSLTAAIPVRLPDELRVLWRWHNGTLDPEAWRLGGFNVLSLSEAIDTYRLQRELEPEAGFAPGEFFPPHFFPFAQVFSDVTAADCSDPGSQVSPVHHLPSHDVRQDYIRTPEVASLGEWAVWQLKALDDGFYWWNPADQHWEAANTGDQQGQRGPAFLSCFRGWS